MPRTNSTNYSVSPRDYDSLTGEPKRPGVPPFSEVEAAARADRPAPAAVAPTAETPAAELPDVPATAVPFYGDVLQDETSDDA